MIMAFDVRRLKEAGVKMRNKPFLTSTVSDNLIAALVIIAIAVLERDLTKAEKEFASVSTLHRGVG